MTTIGRVNAALGPLTTLTVVVQLTMRFGAEQLRFTGPVNPLLVMLTLVLVELVPLGLALPTAAGALGVLSEMLDEPPPPAVTTTRGRLVAALGTPEPAAVRFS